MSKLLLLSMRNNPTNYEIIFMFLYIIQILLNFPLMTFFSFYYQTTHMYLAKETA